MVWKKIYNYNYSISEFGLIRNDITNKILKKRFDACGYVTCQLYPGNGLPCFQSSVHRLVAFIFIGEPPQGKNQVNHIDCNKENNHYSNLEWVSPKENSQHAVAHNLFPRGDNHHSTKISDKQINEIRVLYSTGKYFQYEIAELFGIDSSQVSRYVTRHRRGRRCA